MEKQEIIQKIELLKFQLIKDLYFDFKIVTGNPNIQQWYKLTWDEFLVACYSLGINLYNCDDRDWQAYFEEQKYFFTKLTGELKSQSDHSTDTE